VSHPAEAVYRRQRAYRAVYDNKGLNVWTRDKDSNIPFSARTGWESLEYTPGSCGGDK